MCIGNNFSLLESQIAIVMIAQQFRFRLQPGHDPQIKAPALLMPTGGMPMLLHSR